jgi:large subunit ribosomal protein L44
MELFCTYEFKFSEIGSGVSKKKLIVCLSLLSRGRESKCLILLPMGHVQKRLASTASKLAVSTSHLTSFPPKESFYKRGKPPAFSAETWASLQPPPPSALTAFAHRIGLASVLTSTDIIQQACTHSSFIPLHEKYYPTQPRLASNAQLATLGNALLGLFATEHMHTSYPHLPTRVLKASVSAHVGPLTCASVAQDLGAAPLLRWNRTV